MGIQRILLYTLLLDESTTNLTGIYDVLNKFLQELDITKVILENTVQKLHTTNQKLENVTHKLENRIESLERGKALEILVRGRSIQVNSYINLSWTNSHKRQ